MASYGKYKTKKGVKWYFQTYSDDPLTGEKKRVMRRGFDSKNEAKIASEELERELRVGKDIFKKVTFEEIAEEFLRQQEKNCEPSTMYSKRSKFKSRILPAFGKLQIDKITFEYCQKWIEQLEGEIDAARDYGIQANLIFKYARRKRLITENPFDLVVYTQTKKEGSSEDSFDGFWNKEEINHFLSIAETQCTLQNYVMFRVAIFTGARKGEILALQENDLIHSTKEINIHHTMYWDKTALNYQLLSPKTQNSYRKVPLDDVTWNLMQKLITANKAAKLASGLLDNLEHHFIFVRGSFRPHRTAYPTEMLQSLCKRFGIKYIKFHGLRHTHASMLFASGANMKEVQDRLGHARIETTMNIYTHITQEMKSDVQNRFIDFMNKEPNEKFPDLLESK
ncbi:MAG: site-specific integrase [Solibacillus sp.]|uniref:site-specific integrase n=1 Tax=Solibacillus sp. TaxID=1909654 RepID=UPI003314EF44